MYQHRFSTYQPEGFSPLTSEFEMTADLRSNDILANKEFSQLVLRNFS